MNIVVGVISPAAIWVMPRRLVDQLRRHFPQHTFLDAWDRDTLRRLLPEADVAFTPFVDRDVFPSAPRLKWVQSPAVGVGGLMYPELLARLRAGFTSLKTRRPSATRRGSAEIYACGRGPRRPKLATVGPGSG